MKATTRQNQEPSGEQELCVDALLLHAHPKDMPTAVGKSVSLAPRALSPSEPSVSPKTTHTAASRERQA